MAALRCAGCPGHHHRAGGDLEALQLRVRAAVRSWDDDFADALVAEVGEAAAALFTRYAAGMPPAYREMFSARRRRRCAAVGVDRRR